MAQQTKFHLDVVSATRQLISQEVDEVTAPGREGEFGVMPGHTPFLTVLGVGELMYKVGAEERFLAVRHGFAEIKHEKVTILAEEAEFPAEIDLKAAEAVKAQAEEEIQQLSQESKEYLEAQAKLERALNQIHVGNLRR